MEPETVASDSESLVIFDSPKSGASKENTIRSARNSKLKRIAASRGNNHALTLSSFARLRVSRSRVRTPPYFEVDAHREASVGPMFSYSFSPDSVAPVSLRVRPPEGPVDVGHVECHIDKLPVELLGEIFIRCLPDIYFFLPRPTMAPMLLCQICGYWRRVALATPTLWVRLSISGRPCRNSSQLSLLELWMKRSFDHSLSLQFGHDVTFWGDRDPAFEIILRHSHRWRYLSLAPSGNLVDQFLKALAAGVTSPLQVLKLDSSACTADQAMQIVSALHHFPHLRRLQFTTHTYTPMLDAPWSQMTHIWLTCPMLDHICLDILSRCSQVEDFRLSQILTPANCTLERSQKVLLRKLFFLQIQLSKDAGAVLDHIICPSLRVLQLKRWRSGPRPSLSFVEFLSRSGCKLESFQLDDDELSEDDIITHLRAPLLKTLRTLELECRRLGLKTLKALSCTDEADAEILLPSLHAIWFKSSNLSSRDDVVEMVESRMDRIVNQPDGMVGASLQNVFIGKHRHPVCRGGRILKVDDTTRLIDRRQA